MFLPCATEACFHAKGSHQKVKHWPASQLFVPVRHQITHVPAIGCLLWLRVDISSLGGKPELISHKGWFNNNQTLEASRKEHSDPTQPQEKMDCSGSRCEHCQLGRAPGAA